MHVLNGVTLTKYTKYILQTIVVARDGTGNANAEADPEYGQENEALVNP